MSSSDFRFSQVTEVEKGEPRKRFLRLRPQAEAEKCFRGFPFSTEVTWEKRKSDYDKFFQREWQGHMSKQNAFFIFQVFSWHKFITKILGKLFAVKYSS